MSELKWSPPRLSIRRDGKIIASPPSYSSSEISLQFVFILKASRAVLFRNTTGFARHDVRVKVGEGAEFKIQS